MARLTITLCQPAALGAGVRKTGVQHTTEYITGTVLRGALAARWIARHGPPRQDNPRREEFIRLFEGDVVFGPLLPGTAVPMPMSCWVHKYDPGSDCLLWWDEALGSHPAHAPGSPPSDKADKVCPQCGEQLRRASGQLRTVRQGQLAAAVRTVEDTHVAIDDDGRAKDGMLFTRQRIDREQVFSGHLTGPGTDLDLITNGVSRLWLGGRRSTAGQATLSIDHAWHPPAPEQPDDRQLILRLATPGIFIDNYCRPQLQPSDAELTRLLEVPAAVTRCWMRWTQVNGWHAASGFPKPAERAAATGSTYVVTCAHPPSPQALARLAAQGIGLRRIEGYGALTHGPDAVLGPLLAQPNSPWQEVSACASP